MKNFQLRNSQEIAQRAMTHRKLQQEVDKVFKKINEGIDVFDTYYTRHENCTNNPSQKEKLESDLKREVKKLQRLREQIKSWQSSPDIKDKDSLLEYRRRVEVSMEQYKVVEKASKEKAYSNISLKRTEILDPEEKAQLEIENFLSQSIDELSRQYESVEVEIDRLQLLNKKRKTHSLANEEKINKLQNLQLRYRWHQQQIELALRLIANEELSPKDVLSIKDDINYFVESNQDDDFIEDETIYDSLDLLSNETIAHEVSQYYANQKLDDAKEKAENEINSIGAKPTSTMVEDSSKLSKRELRRIEREAKKAAKLAAKNTAALTASQGPTITIKMSARSLSPIDNDGKLTADEGETSLNNSPVVPTGAVTTTTTTTTSNTPSPKAKKIEIPPLNRTSSKSKTQISSSTTTPTTTGTQSTVKSSDNNDLVLGSNLVHTHIHPGANNVTGTTILKPATVPARPVGDVKWADAAAQNSKKEELKNVSKSTEKTRLNSISPISTPRETTPSLLNSVINNKSENSELLSDSISTPNKSSAANAAAILAAGAAAVTQNNQQFHRSHTPILNNINDDISHNNGNSSNNLINLIKNEPVGSNNKDSELPDNENSLIEDDMTDKEIDYEDEEFFSEFDEYLFEYANDDIISNEPQVENFTVDEIEARNNKLKFLQSKYDKDINLLSIPNGINEFIINYEINQNKLYANNGKLGGYRHSIDMCQVNRLENVPFGVNPPNPLDAFRSTQQWDSVRSEISNDNKSDVNINDILNKFENLEMFSLFYNYYFAVLPIEKRIAYELLKGKNWQLGINENMWFLRQGEVKLQQETFEIADYKIFKLDDWSVIDKINFRLDYSHLKFPPNINFSIKMSNGINNTNVTIGNDYEERELSHGQQLLQQLNANKH